MLNLFSIARLPRIEFGHGVFNKTAAICANYGNRVLLVTGASSFQQSPHFDQLKKDFDKLNLSWQVCNVPGEPSPQMVDDAVEKFAAENFDMVLAIGGGSALDAAKAIAGLLRVKRSVMDYLEGVGPELPYEGPAVPFIAVPTTAGTGSEATKNAVLSVQGKNGFKKSFRHDTLVAEYAIVDPSLIASCPHDVIAANGMDALTQLLESYVSTRANPLTDALCISGLRFARESLINLHLNVDDTEAQYGMAYASLLSGICLAQTGLGSVHGLASPLGAFYPIPHGVVCGTLVAEATAKNIDCMLQREVTNPALDKYARVGEILCQQRFYNKHEAWESLCTMLQQLTHDMDLPALSAYGVTEAELDHVVANSRGSSMKTNPIVLTDAELREVLVKRL
jgi:alcohol dehydrogenase